MIRALAAIRPRPRATTPRVLWGFLAAVLALAALSAAAALGTAASIGEAARTIGRDAEPSVALALRMTATLSDMNAAALGDSLVGAGEAIGTSLQFRDGLSRLSSDIVEAARNITYGEAEAGPLRELQRDLALYQQAIADARYAGQGDPWTTSRRVQWASRVNQFFAVPPAQALARANADELERRYADYRSTSLAYGAATVAAFGLLVAALIVAQVWLTRRTRRITNPALAAATLVAASAGLWFGGAALAERGDLRAAKADAYDSLHVLFEAKAATGALRADASLWLLDPEARTDAQARVEADERELLTAEPGQARNVIQRGLELESAGKPDEALRAVSHLGGLLGQELDNVTFGPPERQAASDAAIRLGDAEDAVRATQAQDVRAHAAAVARWLDARPGGGAAVFAAVQDALDRTIAVNQGEFDRRVSDALRTAALMPWVAAGALAATALLAAAGLWLRLREYR